MNITDELRAWVTGAKPAVVDGCSISVGTMTYGCKKALLAIADRIDAEHERITHNLTDALHKQEDATRELDEKSVLLPVDANGVPIHIGDVMEWCDSGDTLTVEGIGKDIVFYIENEGAEWTSARNKRHHEPTVEDVLREFAYGLGVSVADSYIAASAAKLRLAKEGE